MQDRAATLTPEEAKALVRDWWEALVAYDVDKVAEFLADDIIREIKFVGQYLPDGGITRGKQKSLENNVALFGALYDLSRLDMTITNMVSDGRSVAMEFVLDGFTAAGARYDHVEYISVIELENGKISHVREYMDALKAKEAHAL